MRARDIMAFPVITVKPNATIQEAARTFVERAISGAPVVDSDGKLVGNITEGDLLYRKEIGTERWHPFWFVQYAEQDTLATEYVKARGRTVEDVMTRKVITANCDMTLNEIAALFEANGIKRVPIVENGEIIGIVSRANLVQAVASTTHRDDVAPPDSKIRAELLEHLERQPWAHTQALNVIVHDGIVELFGNTGSEAEKKAICVAAKAIAGVRVVKDHVIVRPRELPHKERDITNR